jgi:hypothetical protein
MSSPLRVKSAFFSAPVSFAIALTVRVSAALKPGQMGAALVGVDVVDERERVLVVAVLVLHGDVHLDVVLHGREGDRLRVEGLLVPGEPLTNSTRPPLAKYVSSTGASWRSSRRVIRMPRLRNASWRSRSASVV